MKVTFNSKCKDELNIKVKYRGMWYYASSLSINIKGELDFEYLHGLDETVDNEHVQDYRIETTHNTRKVSE